MPSIALIVVDAWEELSAYDSELTLYDEEVNSFMNYLSFVTYYESLKSDITVYHSHGNKPISNKFYDYPQNFIALDDINQISTSHEHYLFCGFHYHMCIFKNIIKLSKIIDTSKMGIVFNLSYSAPELYSECLSFDYLDIHESVEDNLELYDCYNLDDTNYDKLKISSIPLYYWTRTGYRMIDIKCV